MKNILVHLDASTRSAERLAVAQRLAKAQQAEVTALYAVLPAFQALPLAAAAEASSVYTLLEELDREQRARALALFKQHTSAGPMTWAEIGSEILEPTLFEHALLADLLVLGQTDPEDRSTGSLPPGFVPTLITHTGKPTLVVPYAGSYAQVGRTVLLAWKPSPEAARAAAAALPWLRQANNIHLACSADAADSPRVGSAALVRWLRLHGVTAPLAMHGLEEAAVGPALLSLASDVDADLLVMGCYGHSRAREWVFGGATRTVLESMTLPVLMAH